MNNTAKKQSQFREFWRIFFQNKPAVVGLVIVILLMLMVIFAEQIVPEKLAFGGENRQWMYALAQGKVYKRWWKTAGRAEDGSCEMPRQSWYYD